MPCHQPFRSVRTLALLLAVAVIPSPSAAQTAVPQPNFSLRNETRFWFKAWPGDFNRDGRTDLIAGTRSTASDEPVNLAVALGRGDGTFGSSRLLNIAAQPLGTGHFNGDAFLDVVILRADGVLAVLPGNGNGTFASSRTIASGIPTIKPFAVIADFDGDSRRDVAVGGVTAAGEGGLLVFPGNGNFTFDPPVELGTPGFPFEGISGDFDKDGDRDIAVVLDCCSLVVYRNGGGFLFSGTETPMAQDLGDITAADINRDGNLDLLIAATSEFISPGSSDTGFIDVLLGRGDGTFANRVLYDAGVRGEFTIVAGDFNRDGKIDVATGNLSPIQNDEFGTQLWDSISIVPGDGTGRLLRATTYALGTQNVSTADAVFVRTHNTLNTSDLNGDGHVDLIASPGVILLNRAAAPNRRPSVFAGADRTVYDGSFMVRGIATDPDRHWLDYEWTIDGTVSFFPVPFLPVVGLEVGTHTFTLRVTDPHGATASDTVRITVAADTDPFVALEYGGPPPSGPATIEWFASEDRGLVRFDLWSSANGGRSWGRITECTALPATARSCVWNNPLDRVIRLVAYDRRGRQFIALANEDIP
jgi:hypothetical protein